MISWDQGYWFVTDIGRPCFLLVPDKTHDTERERLNCH
jgi:hypothetical protein